MQSFPKMNTNSRTKYAVAFMPSILTQFASTLLLILAVCEPVVQVQGREHLTRSSRVMNFTNDHSFQSQMKPTNLNNYSSLENGSFARSMVASVEGTPRLNGYTKKKIGEKIKQKIKQKIDQKFGLGKNSFLTGFALGFLVFGLKKLLLPIIIGVQIVKSIVIAMFLPSLLGGVGKMISKGASAFLQSSSSSSMPIPLGASSLSDSSSLSDMDFKDYKEQPVGTVMAPATHFDSDSAGSDALHNTAYSEYPLAGAGGVVDPSTVYTIYPFPPPPASMSIVGAGPQIPYASPAKWKMGSTKSTTLSTNNNGGSSNSNSITGKTPSKPVDTASSKFFTVGMPSGGTYSAVTSVGGGSVASFGGSRIKDKSEEFKVFHNIPSSSQLLTNYDPFYSPLLSRMDSVFNQLGHTTEVCRQKLVCSMYRNPAKYAPFSNLVSAQLSRELDELRKPSSMDNVDILRFFKYMKAAKDGQDGQSCDVIYPECRTTRANQNENTPIVSTYNDINKLVHARHFNPTRKFRR